MGYKISLPGLLSIQAIADYQRGEALYYIFGRLATDPSDTPGAHLIVVGEPDPEGPGTRVKRMVASCTSSKPQRRRTTAVAVKPEASGN